MGGPGLETALWILRDGTARGALVAQSREAAFIFLLKWCKEDGGSFDGWHALPTPGSQVGASFVL